MRPSTAWSCTAPGSCTSPSFVREILFCLISKLSFSYTYSIMRIPVLWIRGILVPVRIRIRHSVPLIYRYASGSGSCSFLLLAFKMQTKNKFFFQIFFAYYFLTLHLQKSLKEVRKKQQKSKFSYYLLDDGRIRIREAQKHWSEAWDRPGSTPEYNPEHCWSRWGFKYC